MNRFFVYHPVFAWVIALFIALFGLLALRSLPVEQYPAVAPPALNLDVVYNGVNAEKFQFDWTEQERQTLRKQYAEPDEKIVIYVGRFVREKGIQVLLAGCSQEGPCSGVLLSVGLHSGLRPGSAYVCSGEGQV